MAMNKIKKGDTVKVITGKDKGKEGKVVSASNGKVLVEGTKTEWIHGIVPQKLRAHKGTEISSGEFKVF